MDNFATTRRGFRGIEHVMSMLELFYSHPENEKVGVREAIENIVSSMEPDGDDMLMGMFFLSAYIRESINRRMNLENMNRFKKEQG